MSMGILIAMMKGALVSPDCEGEEEISEPTEEPTSGEDCHDGIDNDGDFIVDCLDSDCFSDSDCLVDQDNDGF